MTYPTFLIAYLLTGLFIAAWSLMAYAFDEEFRREMDLDAGLGFIPHGHAVFAIIVIVTSPLPPAAGIVALVRWLLGIEEGE
jgi:hypothetical protein